MQSCVTISLVPQAKGGPFVLWDGLEASCATAAELGFDAVEIFAPDAATLLAPAVGETVRRHGLKLAAAGTGGGWVIHKWHLTHPDPDIRAKARGFITGIINAAGALGAPAIIGSMQGRFEGTVSRDQAVAWLTEALNDLGEAAARHNVPLLYEPLNRYETNLINRIQDGVELLGSLNTTNVRLLADLFHMNIEEASIPGALRAGAKHVGHIHFVDSNRQPVGNGHLQFAAIAKTLTEIGYHGYLSAEAFPLPDPRSAALQTITAFNGLFKP